MKRSIFLTAILAATLPLSAAPSGKMQMRDVATHDQLSSKLRMAQQKDPVRLLGPPAGKHEEDPSKQNTSRDLIKESTVLCYNGNLTLVPKEAVIFVPDELKDRIGVKPKQKIKRWSEFYQVNRGWIRTIEVSRDQAMGYKPIAEGTMEAVKAGSSMVVATFSGGPISVLPLKTEEELEAIAEREGDDDDSETDTTEQ